MKMTMREDGRADVEISGKDFEEVGKRTGFWADLNALEGLDDEVEVDVSDLLQRHEDEEGRSVVMALEVVEGKGDGLLDDLQMPTSPRKSAT